MKSSLPKIGAAIAARKDEQDEDFVLIARTDAARTLGWKEAIRRVAAYRRAGADAILLPGAPKEKGGAEEGRGGPRCTPMGSAGLDQGLTVKDYEEAGVKIVSGIEGLFAAAKAVRDVYQELKETGFIKEKHCYSSVAMAEISGILKAGKWTDLGKKYSAT